MWICGIQISLQEAWEVTRQTHGPCRVQAQDKRSVLSRVRCHQQWKSYKTLLISGILLLTSFQVYEAIKHSFSTPPENHSKSNTVPFKQNKTKIKQKHPTYMELKKKNSTFSAFISLFIFFKLSLLFTTFILWNWTHILNNLCSLDPPINM